jgi:hypothetical protein
VAITVAASDLTEDVRVRLTLPAFASGSGFLSTEQVYRMLSQSCRALSVVLHNAFGDTDFLTRSTATTVAATATIAAPSGMHRLVSVHWNRSSTEAVQLRTATEHDLGNLSSRSWDELRPAYMLSRSTIYLYPVPSAAYTLTLQYTTGVVTSAVTSATTFDAEPLWDEWIVLDVCEKVANKEEKPRFAAERGRVEAMITKNAGKRDQFAVHSVGDNSWDPIVHPWRPW